MSWNPYPALNNANWGGNVPLVTRNQLISTINGLLTEANFSTIHVSSIDAYYLSSTYANISTLHVENAYVSTLYNDIGYFSTISTQQAYVSSFYGENAYISTLKGNHACFSTLCASSFKADYAYIKSLSSAFGVFSTIEGLEISTPFINADLILTSTIQFQLPSPDVNLTIDLGLGQAIGGFMEGLGIAVGGAAIGFGTAIGLLATALAGLFSSRGNNTITNNYEMINGTTQLQFSTLGFDYSFYSSIYRTVSSPVANLIPGREIFISTIFPAGTKCVRTCSDPIALAFSTPAMLGSTVQSFGQWFPLQKELFDNISSLNISSGSLNVGSVNVNNFIAKNYISAPLAEISSGYLEYLQIAQSNIYDTSTTTLLDIRTDFRQQSTFVGYFGTSSITYSGVFGFNPTETNISSWDKYLLNITANAPVGPFSLLNGYSNPLEFDIQNAGGTNPLINFKDQNGVVQSFLFGLGAKWRLSTATTTGSNFYLNTSPVGSLSTFYDIPFGYTDLKVLQNIDATTFLINKPIIFDQRISSVISTTNMIDILTTGAQFPPSTIGYVSSSVYFVNPLTPTATTYSNWNFNLVTMSVGTSFLVMSNAYSNATRFDIYNNNVGGSNAILFNDSNGVGQSFGQIVGETWRFTSVPGFSNRFYLDSNLASNGIPFLTSTYQILTTELDILQNISCTTFVTQQNFELQASSIKFKNIDVINDQIYPRLANNHLSKLTISTGGFPGTNGSANNSVLPMGIAFQGMLSNQIYTTGAPDTNGTWLMDFSPVALHGANANVNMLTIGITDYYSWSTSQYTVIYSIDEQVRPFLGYGGGPQYFNMPQIPIDVNKLRQDVPSTFFSTIIPGLDRLNLPIVAIKNSNTNQMYINEVPLNIYGSYFPFGIE